MFSTAVCCRAVLSRVQLLVTPWAGACQAPLSMEFSRQGYWSEFPFLSQGIFPTQGSNPSLASTVQAGRFFSTDPPGKPCSVLLLLLLSCFSRVRLCATPQTVAHQAPPSVGLAWALEWVAVSFSSAWKWKVKVKSLSCVRLLVTPWTAAYQAPPSMGFPRQEYWSGLPLPSPCSVLLSNKKEPSNDTCRNLDGLCWMEKPVPKGWISYDSMYIKMENRLLISRS